MAGPHFEYQIRESARAKYMSLRITVDRGLEVVIPRGFNRNLIPVFLREKHFWIESSLAKVELARQRRTAAPSDLLPKEIQLASVGKSWIVDYVPQRTQHIRLQDNGEGQLRLSGAISDQAACYAVLQRWTHRQAFSVLVPWLKRLSTETGIAYAKTAIRCQKSRWGSCSSSGTISLNQKLLFVSPDLVSYVLIHELCHMREMNHSRHFWKLVGQFFPEFRHARRRLKEAWYQMPRWAG